MEENNERWKDKNSKDLSMLNDQHSSTIYDLKNNYSNELNAKTEEIKSTYDKYN